MFRRGFSRCANLIFIIRRKLTTVGEIKEAKPFSDVPQAPSFSISGWNNLPDIENNKLSGARHSAESKYKSYGPIVREAISKSLSVVRLFNVEDIEKVYRNEGRCPFRLPFESMKKYRENRPDLYSNAGLLFSNGKVWHDVRTQVQPHMLKPKAVHAYLKDMDKVAMELVNRTALLKQESAGEVKDYLSELFKWALESLGVVGLDTRLGCLEMEPSEETIQMIRILHEMFEQLFQLEFNYGISSKNAKESVFTRFTNNMNEFCRIVQKYLFLAKERLKTMPEDHESTVLETLITTSKDPRHVTTMVTDMFFAGIETTSTAVVFTLYHLARNPECQEKAYQEVKSILQREGMTVQALNEAKYIKACINESMRLTPVVTAIPRILPEDMVLSGYNIPAQTMVIIQNYVTGRLEKNVKDPFEFRPERFLRDQKSHVSFSFLPFGFGTRSCVGRRIAEQEMWTLLIRLLEKYRVEYNHGDIDFVARFINCPTKPLNFQFIDR